MFAVRVVYSLSGSIFACSAGSLLCPAGVVRGTNKSKRKTDGLMFDFRRVELSATAGFFSSVQQAGDIVKDLTLPL